ncbi:MAG: homoserine dehydrogenase [Desulfovibrio sp.]
MEVIHLGIAGFGTVGSGLAKILHENGSWIEKRLGKKIAIKSVLVRDLKKPRAFQLDDSVTVTDNPEVLYNDPEVDIVVELIGGIETAKKLILGAIANGKHVVTANKHLLAEHGKELFASAAENGCGLFYEASTAGGIPVVQTLKESLAGDKIMKLSGILNGTANYILSEMTTRGLNFTTALTQAQDLGYAEADPTFDVEGVDAAHKLVVLTRLAYGQDYPLSKLPVTGITGVTPLDIQFAREFGYRIKLIASVQEVDGKLDASVQPALVRYTFLLARVGGNYNAVRIEGNAVGPVMLHGQGAGDKPTGSAVLADVMNLCRHMNRAGCKESYQPDNTGFCNAPLPEANILEPEQAESEYYFRFTVADRTGVMAAISTAMATHGISIAQAVQKGEEDDTEIPIVFLTHHATAKAAKDTIDEIDAMDFTLKPAVCFKIL